jgi:SAM-dependent methyltransferase
MTPTAAAEPTPRSDYGAWEHAEVARSSVEASLTPAAALRVGTGIRRRYLNPPEDTAYPLEYAYWLLGDVRSREVLDLGCGSGANTVLLADRGARITGLDLSPDLIDLARQRLAVSDVDAANVRFIVGSAHAIDLPDASVDVVFGMAILHHLDLQQTAAEVWRVLRPGGRAIFQEPVRNSRTIRAIRRLIPYQTPDVSPYERPLTDAEIAAFVKPFRTFRARAFVLPHVALAQVLPGAAHWIPAAYRLDRALLQMKSRSHFAGVRVFEVTK